MLDFGVLSRPIDNPFMPPKCPNDCVFISSFRLGVPNLVRVPMFMISWIVRNRTSNVGVLDVVGLPNSKLNMFVVKLYGFVDVQVICRCCA